MPLLLELHGGLEEVHVASHQSIYAVQLLQRLFAVVPVVPDEPSHHGPVLLLDVGAVVLLVGPGAGEGDPLPLAIGVQPMVYELAAVVRVQAQ